MIIIFRRSNEPVQYHYVNHSRQGFMVHKSPEPEGAAQGQGLFIGCIQWVTLLPS